MLKTIKYTAAFVLALILAVFPAACTGRSAAAENTLAPRGHGGESGVCAHERHDTDTRRCSVCGEIVPHHYVDGRCTLCGEKPAFVTGTLDARFYEPVSENAGRLETIRYKALQCDSKRILHRAMTVYVPYNYDPAQKYDVFLLLHGQNGRRGAWFEELHEEKDRVTGGKNLCDHLFAEGYLRPMLLVAIDTCTGNTINRSELGEAQIRYELRHAILPTIIENYSTYAESGSYEDIVAARDHFGIGGVSNGSLYTQYAGLIPNLELFSNYLCLSGCNNAPALRERLDADAKDRYPVHMYFTGAGDEDYSLEKINVGYEILIESDSPLKDGQNAFRVIVEGEHEWCTWFTELYNALPLMFP